MRKIRSGDEVLVTAGRNKGQRGVVRINLIRRDRVVVEGVNIVKKHIKRGRARQSGIVEVEAPLHVSNVLLVCPNCKQPTRVGVRPNEAGKNERYCKKCEATVPRPEA
ncbi:MAG: LSU ribosomal protein L24p (L26e) [uncultured Thermomicrobiales bacterium]|jgi:large subunit ribosomal protein L24|uniref:Large ribosomal subunit protein uL24 n=1 Tax=uncultured Thermomicrobiales bacterium TaxID=1645740 RepID=A0A6J4VHU2_9BACT|nr:MAG: LSU ribosomal protein L24p (L26e) [uncultured Thermomicrobiales bacterium]